MYVLLFFEAIGVPMLIWGIIDLAAATLVLRVFWCILSLIVIVIGIFSFKTGFITWS